MPRAYQFWALTASDCCVAMQSHRRWRLWVRLGHRERIPKTFLARQMNPKIRTRSQRQRRWSLCARFDLAHRSKMGVGVAESFRLVPLTW